MRAEARRRENHEISCRALHLAQVGSLTDGEVRRTKPTLLSASIPWRCKAS